MGRECKQNVCNTDPAAAASNLSEEEKADGPFHDDDEDDEDDDHGTFLGYVYPSEVEVKGKASRTELYQCHKCGGFTRFPRFNSACVRAKSVVINTLFPPQHNKMT